MRRQSFKAHQEKISSSSSVEEKCSFSAWINPSLLLGLSIHDDQIGVFENVEDIEIDWANKLTKDMVGVWRVEGDVDGGDVVVGLKGPHDVVVVRWKIGANDVFVTLIASLRSLIWNNKNKKIKSSSESNQIHHEKCCGCLICP